MSLPSHERILPHFDISEQGLRELEIWLLQHFQDLQWGPWVYVGTYPVGEGTTAISPPFQHGWQNVGGGMQRLRFRRTVPTRIKKVQSLEIEGDISNPSVVTNSVIFTLPAGYRPGEDSGPVVAANTDGDIVLWEIATSGDVTYVGEATAGGGGTGTVSEVTSGDSSVTITDPTGPTVDLSVSFPVGVDSVSKSGSTPLTGDVTFTGGTHITLTQAAQNIEVAFTGDVASHILLADGRATPFAFTDLLQWDDGTDFMWSDPA